MWPKVKRGGLAHLSAVIGPELMQCTPTFLGGILGTVKRGLECLVKLQVPAGSSSLLVASQASALSAFSHPAHPGALVGNPRAEDYDGRDSSIAVVESIVGFYITPIRRRSLVE